MVTKKTNFFAVRQMWCTHNEVALAQWILRQEAGQVRHGLQGLPRRTDLEGSRCLAANELPAIAQPAATVLQDGEMTRGDRYRLSDDVQVKLADGITDITYIFNVVTMLDQMGMLKEKVYKQRCCWCSKERDDNALGWVMSGRQLYCPACYKAKSEASDNLEGDTYGT